MKNKYFFPLNYHYSAKLLGIFEYKLLIPLMLYAFILYLILKPLMINIITKIILFILFFLPTTLLLNSKVNSEPFYHFIFIVVKHYLTSKKYLYKRVIWCGINLNCITD